MCERTSSEAHANTVSYLNCSARGDISVQGQKKKKQQAGLEVNGDRRCEEAAGWAGDMLTDALGFRTDLEPEDDTAAVRERNPMFKQGNTFMVSSWVFTLKMILYSFFFFFAWILFLWPMATKIKPNVNCSCCSV